MVLKIKLLLQYNQKKCRMNYLERGASIKYKCYIVIELTFLKELLLIKQANQKTVIVVIIGTFKTKGY